MITYLPSFLALADSQEAELFQPPAMVNGVLGKTYTFVTKLKITPPDTMDARLVMSGADEGSASVLMITTEGQGLNLKEDWKVKHRGKEYIINHINYFPDYHKKDFTYFELIIEEPKDGTNVNR